jgi:multidrug efflux pump subunit AcrA (membrane-fusion protein)
MNLPRPVYIAIRIVIPLLILAVGGFGYVKLKELRKPPARSRPDPGLPLVETVPAKKHTGELTLHMDGTVVPYREINLSAEVAGRVVSKGSESESKNVRAGHFVRKGDLLVGIDPQDYKLEVERQTQLHAQAVASIDETQAEIGNSRVQVGLLKLDHERQTADLVKVKNLRAEGAATETDQDNAEQSHRMSQSALSKEENNLKLLEARLRRLQSARDLAGTELQKAQLDQRRCKIFAPCDGVIVEDHVEVDSFVQRGAMLMKLQDTSATEVRTSLRIDDVYWLWQHKSVAESGSDETGSNRTPRNEWEIPDVPVWVTYELNGATFRWEGRLARHEGSGLDERTRTVPCRVLVSNPTSASRQNVDDVATLPPPALYRGMFVTVQLRTTPQEELIDVPERAIRPGSVIWKVSDGKLKRLEVRIARVNDGRALIHASGSDLSAGDPVVVSQLTTETSGMAVRVQGDEKAAKSKEKTNKKTPAAPSGAAR